MHIVSFGELAESLVRAAKPRSRAGGRRIIRRRLQPPPRLVLREKTVQIDFVPRPERNVPESNELLLGQIPAMRFGATKAGGESTDCACEPNHNWALGEPREALGRLRGGGELA